MRNLRPEESFVSQGWDNSELNGNRPGTIRGTAFVIPPR